jgi:hypothetical protein
MPLRTRRPAARLAVLSLLALLAGGCGGQSDTPAAGSAATSTTAAATTTTVPPLNAEERAWLKAVSSVRTKVENSFKAGTVAMTRAKMVETGNALAAWSRQLRRIGAPSDRLQPAYTLVKKVIVAFDKGAKCLATAARVSGASGSVIAGTPEERIQSKALECGLAAQGNGANMLGDADRTGDELKAKYG